ncbi:MAG: N-acetyltransferase [Selenomonadaceae bacterium]|nr:N-acetyltransferase [Selenomonadaceae bacterium]
MIENLQFHHEANRIYAEDDSGKMIAEIVFPESSPGVCEIVHTYVDDSLRGRGVAGKLMELAASAIEGQGKKVTASCSYAMKWLAKKEGIDLKIGPACGVLGHRP